VKDKLNADALAESGDVELDERPGVQAVNAEMIYQYVIDKNELPEESARPFSEWLHGIFTDFNEEGEATNGQVVDGALTAWCGGRVQPHFE
jgi:hypothetical protein